MPYAEKCKRPLYLLIGFVGMFLCGIGDILFSFRGDGEPTAVSGMMSMNITEVPLYFYFMSFFIGIIAMVGYFFGSRAMYSYCLDRLGKPTKALKAYNFGAVMMSLGIFGIHSVCSMALIALRCAAEAGLSPELINEHFALPMMIPFAVTTTWQTIADLIAGIIYSFRVQKGYPRIKTLAYLRSACALCYIQYSESNHHGCDRKCSYRKAPVRR